MILNVRKIKPKGLKKLFFSTKLEAIAAVENTFSDQKPPVEKPPNKIENEDIESLKKIKKNLLENIPQLLNHK